MKTGGAPASAFRLVCLAAALTCGGCGDGSPTDGAPRPSEPLACDLPTQFLIDSGLGRGGIPTLQNPEFVPVDPNPQNAYLLPDDRVIGVMIDGEPVAVPHNVLWYHEIVNLDRGSERIAVTYCPVTGSSLAFDRGTIAGQELGITGLLFMNNLVMYNRGDPESLWPQMWGEARCKAQLGRTLERVPVVEMTWQAWRELYPRSTVVSSDANISRNYTLNPYGTYEQDDQFLYAAMPPIDPRRPPKERVIGLPSTAGDAGVALPFSELEASPTSWATVELSWNGQRVVVLWADVPRGGGVFRAVHPVSGAPLSFRTTTTGGIQDTTTGTRWSITGEAVAGPLVGERLEAVGEAYVAFWGAWAAFHPNTRLWAAP